MSPCSSPRPDKIAHVHADRAVLDCAGRCLHNPCMARYSYSRLDAYASCPLKYRFQYVDRVKVDVGPSVEAFLGSRVHDALEWLYDQVQLGLIPSTDEVLARYRQSWDAEWTDGVRIVRRKMTADAYRQAGVKCLELYCARHAPFDGEIVLGLEMPFSVSLDEGTELHGFIDRLAKRDGDIYEVHDYKTSGTLPRPEDAVRDVQAGLYALATRSRFPHAREIRLVWHYLRFDERLVTTRSSEALEALRADTLRRIREIERAAEFPPRESALCAWCEYFGICPAKGHRQSLEALPASRRLGEPGSVLVDRLAELRSGLRETTTRIEEEVARVEEALVSYARDHGFSVVVGTEAEATVAEEEALILPGAGDPDRAELEARLRRLGLWEASVGVSLDRVKKLVRDGDLSEEARGEILALARVEPKVTVRLRRRSAE